jgi:ribosomal protein S18 acetylase RimI-like enzyme
MVLPRIRPLTWSDYASCRFMFEDVFDVTELKKFCSAWKTRSEQHSYVAVYTDTIVGFALVGSKNDIQYICVHQDFQKQKIGTLLLEKVLDSMSDERRVYLVTADDKRLTNWYGKYGFEVTKNYQYNSAYSGSDMVLRQRCRRYTTAETVGSRNHESSGVGE